MLRHFLSRNIPHFNRVLLVESGSRHLLENILPGMYQSHPEIQQVDLFTCFPGAPKHFDSARGRIFRSQDFHAGDARSGLYAELRAQQYLVLGMICADQPILFKWKWMLAWQVPAKIFILNENGDYFWLDRTNWKTIVEFLLFRAGMTGDQGVVNIGRLLLFPFVLTYLLLFAGWVHLKRRVRA